MEPFIGEIRLFAGTYAPKGWALCNGQLMPLQQNTALFSIFGLAYGGDGKTTFALPNLQGRALVHPSPTVVLGQFGGEEAHTLTWSEMPTHTHPASVSSQEAQQVSPKGSVWAAKENSYAPVDDKIMNLAMSPAALTSAGGGQAHENRQPYLAMNFCIALQGVFPPRGEGASLVEGYLGEIRMFGGNFAPSGWALCNGQTLPIESYAALYSIIGPRYGGDGVRNFALPDLQGRAPMHWGQGSGLSPRELGQQVGSESVSLKEIEMPAHRHTARAADQVGSTNSPENAVWAQAPKQGKFVKRETPLYQGSPESGKQMNVLALSNAGSGTPHNNRQPYLAVNFIICLDGQFPPRE